MWQKKCGRKIMQQKNAAEKTRGRKSAAEKVRQKNAAEKVQRKIAVAESRQQNRGSRTLQEEKRYGFHMCSVEFMNLVEGFPCKSVGFPLGSLGLVVELI
jgi:hypothetical protein